MGRLLPLELEGASPPGHWRFERPARVVADARISKSIDKQNPGIRRIPHDVIGDANVPRRRSLGVQRVFARKPHARARARE
jgi:hypothetical protein